MGEESEDLAAQPQTFTSGSLSYQKSIPVLRDKKVLLCSYGWLVFYDDTNKVLCLCNSTTFDQTLILPTLHHHSWYKIDSCVLLPPSSNYNSSDTFCNLEGFKLLVFFQNLASIMCCRLGSDHKWSETEYWKQLSLLSPPNLVDLQVEEGHGPLFLSQAVACSGLTYAMLSANWLPYYCFVFLIEIVEEDDEEEERQLSLLLSGMQVPETINIATTPEPHNVVRLLESCGELFLLGLNCETLVVEVYKLSSVVWERIKTIKDRAFFISESYSFSCPASGSGHIYFTGSSKCTKESSDLYCYHMNDQSVSMSGLPELPITAQVLIWQEDNAGNTNTQAKSSTTVSISKLDDGNRDNDDKRLCNLPSGLLGEVLKHLTAVDYLNFRATSRMFHSLAPLVNWRRSPSSNTNHFRFPLLMFVDQDQSLYKFVDHSNNTSYLIGVPESLQGHTVISYSYDGWILLSEVPLVGVHLYNPFTKDIISYADEQILGMEHSLFFCSMPFETKRSYSIVATVFNPQEFVVVCFIDDPTDHWNVVEVDLNEDFEVTVPISPVLFRNALYFLDKKGNVGKLEMNAPTEMSWEVLDIPQRPACFGSFDQNFLLECGGELISVFTGGVGKWVAVYKLNGDRVWEIVTSLGSYDLYLSVTSCFSVLTSTGLGGGSRIYFPCVGDSGIVYFCLSTDKWHFSGSPDSSPDCYNARRHVNSCWIRPRW